MNGFNFLNVKLLKSVIEKKKIIYLPPISELVLYFENIVSFDKHRAYRIQFFKLR
jgi:hypothetical protein